ncbi:uncharacterized protein CCDC198 isoform X3 [Neophocaena asiaeorientalis asiaeorientalis]|uniref:Uncharacterized protein CCDC198 isoform X3 n=1 Tax=Neophocaena asiaeorientalis asiaeorientalis TaxID=1706337 RepID=A0A341ABE3_NEOAA|nr:uncharacterized protein CCDC198 isoform X3 [Neophocaena asiaeorientalis asiaeorientalis]
MGLSHSKAHPRVTKVAPLQNKEEETPSAGPVDFVFTENPEEESSYSFARLEERNKALEGRLPPLRETWYGRYSAGPRAMYFDIPLEQGETSIIKRHPPRRLQKLEPIDLPQVITSERLLSQEEAGRTHKAKAQVELKTSLHKEARTNKQKQRDHKVKKILQSIPRNDDGDFLTLLPDETLNRSPENTQSAEFLEHQASNDNCPQKIGKLETWFREREARGQLLWDSSSSDSDELGKDEKKPRALVRTRTERIPLSDEFFD